MAHNRFQGPNFGGRNGRRPSAAATHEITEDHGGLFHNRSTLSVVDSRISETSHRNIADESNMSNRSHILPSIRSAKKPHLHGEREERIAPYHDPMGRPLRRHGTETIGDLLLHPLKELQLHHKRADAYETEKKEWNEKHPESIVSIRDIEPEESVM